MLFDDFTEDGVEYSPGEFERRWTNHATDELMMREFDRLAHENYRDLAPGLTEKDAPGKAIVFAITKNHATRLARILNDLHPEAKGDYAVVITSDIADPEAAIKRFKRDSYPRVAVSAGYDPDKVSNGGRVETPNENGIPALLETWKAYKASGFQNPPGPEANTLLESGAVEPACWWASISTLSESSYNLSAGAYRPRTTNIVEHHCPQKLITELLETEEAIVKGLRHLQSIL